jgi:indolepyruvate ferredoxin oxidoreductase beta subunit
VNPNVTSVVIVGVGGQGILLATQIAARAALLAGHDVKTNEVHGMAQRGGSVVAQVRFGAKVYSPLVPEGTARVLVSFERIEALRFREFLAFDGLAVVSSQAIIPVTVSSGQASYPADAVERLRMAFPRLAYVDAVAVAEKLCDTRVANVVLLGAMSTALTISMDCWTDAIDQCVKPEFRQINRKAFEEGKRLAPPR